MKGIAKFYGKDVDTERDESTGEEIGSPLQYSWASLVAQLVKNPPANAGDLGLLPGLGRSSGEGKGYPLQCSGLESSMDYMYSQWGHKESDAQSDRLSDFRFSSQTEEDKYHRISLVCGI